MKKIALLMIIVLASSLLLTYKILAAKPVSHPEWVAHPGRTNRYGCHTCRTNCERWGLEYGEYHCH